MAPSSNFCWLCDWNLAWFPSFVRLMVHFLLYLSFPLPGLDDTHSLQCTSYFEYASVGLRHLASCSWASLCARMTIRHTSAICPMETSLAFLCWEPVRTRPMAAFAAPRSTMRPFRTLESSTTKDVCLPQHPVARFFACSTRADIPPVPVTGAPRLMRPRDRSRRL